VGVSAILQAFEFLEHDVDGFIPGDTFELAFASLTHPLHWISESVWGIFQGDAGHAFNTSFATRPGISADLFEQAIFDAGEDSALRFALVTHGGDPF
jgi:hypothetical protein